MTTNKATRSRLTFEETAGSFLVAVRDCESFAVLKFRCLRYFRSHGVKSVSYHHFPHHGSADEEPSINVVSVGFPRSFSEKYDQEKLHKVDPSLRKVMADTKARWWKNIDYSTGLRHEERAFLKAAASEPMGIGIVAPVFGPLGRNGFVALGFGITAPEIGDAELILAHACCQAAHLQYCDLLQARLPKTIRLSRREHEIMYWVARGKSNGVIADILGITENTVITHLRRGYKKLGVNDRVTAALRALSVGELSQW